MLKLRACHPTVFHDRTTLHKKDCKVGLSERRTFWFVCKTWSNSWRERARAAETSARREIQDVEQFLAEKLLRPRRLDFADKWRLSATRDH